MKTFIQFFSLLIVSSGAVSAGVFVDDGIVAKDNQFPSVVRIGNYEVSRGREFLASSCSGTLIAPDIVLTAAHCMVKGGVQRVSLAGDSSGKTRDSIKVIRSFSPSFFKALWDRADKLNKLTKTRKDMDNWSLSNSLLARKFNRSCDKRDSFDIAFLQLEKPQVFPVGKPSILGCRSRLTPGNTEMTVAGYGTKIMTTDPLVDANSKGGLNYGYNNLAISDLPGFVYFIKKSPGKQVTNTGDSGGPLFSKRNSSIVYGLAASGTPDTNDTGMLDSNFVNLSSSRARVVYKEMLEARDLPGNLREILEDCVD